MKEYLRSLLNRVTIKIIRFIFGINSNVYKLVTNTQNLNFDFISDCLINSTIEKNVKLNPPYQICNSEVGDYSYISQNSIIKNTKIGKFCSIGPNLVCGWGIHPTNGISTAPMFYSTLKQNGITLSKEDKIKEFLPITIGNDVFIGMNVSILDGVTIGDGAVIGAGAVINNDVPPYAIVVGCPAKIIKYRFDNKIISELLAIKWWEFKKENLSMIENYFWQVQIFLEKLNNTK